MTKWPNDHICCVLCLCLCLFLNKVLLGLRTLCQHGRRQAAPRHIKLRSVCKASWRSDAVLMPRVGVIMEIGHRMWRRQGAQAPITAIVRAIDAILIRGSMAHGELGKTQTDFSEHGLCIRNTDYVFEHELCFWTRITRMIRIIICTRILLCIWNAHGSHGCMFALGRSHEVYWTKTTRMR